MSVTNEKDFQQQVSRRSQLVLLCSQEPQTASALERGLKVAKRTVAKDIAWFKQHFPNQFLRTPHAKSGGDRFAFKWEGLPPHFLLNPIDYITENELLAMVSACDYFAQPDGDLTSWLASSLLGIIQRAGLEREGKDLTLCAIIVSRFGAIAEDPLVLSTCMGAVVGGYSLIFNYENIKGERKKIHLLPSRMVMIRGEWFVFAWNENRIKSYRVARMFDILRVVEAPAKQPAHIEAAEIDLMLSDSFYATGSTQSQHRKRVVMRVSPKARPHIINRRWGARQTWDDTSKDLPEGWSRLSFTTSGMEECRYWALSQGSDIVVEKPAELCHWLQQEAARIGSLYG